jgi:hypothetical protein
MGASRPGAEIDHRGGMLVMMVMGVMRVIMMMPIMAGAVNVMAMHGAIGVGMLVATCAFDHGLTAGASANRTHQSTSNSLILSSSPEIICN